MDPRLLCSMPRWYQAAPQRHAYIRILFSFYEVAPLPSPLPFTSRFLCTASHVSCAFFCLSQSFLNFFNLLFVKGSPPFSLVGIPSSSHASYISSFGGWNISKWLNFPFSIFAASSCFHLAFSASFA